MASAPGVDALHIELRAPLLEHSASDDANDAKARIRSALKRAARKVVLAQRAARPVSSKGVPLLRRSSVRHVLSATGLAAGRGNRPGAHSDADGSYASELPEAAVELAARFVDDAMHNRNPNTRVAAVLNMPSLSRSVSAVSITSTQPEGANGSSSANIATQASAARARNSSSVTPWSERLLTSRAYRYALQLVVVVHCILAFWEPLPPSTNTPSFSWTPAIVELLCILVYAVDQLLTYRTFGLHYYHDKKWEPVFTVMMLACWADWFAFYVGSQHAMFRLLTSVLRTIPRMLDISLMLFVLVMFYGTLGQQLFNRQQVAGYSPMDDNFDSWPAASLAIYVLTTTENYPNVANPAYKTRPVVATIFFVSALFVMLWFILPLILAIVYDHYKDVHKEMVRAKRVKSYVSLVYAYHTLMGEDGDREMDRATFVRLVQHVRRVNEEQANLMFDVVDEDGSGAITIAEFLRLPGILRLKFTRLPPPEVPPPRDASIMRMWYDVKAWTRTVVQSQWFYYSAVIITIAAAAVGGIWTVEYQRSYDSCMCINQWEPADDQPVSPTLPDGSSAVHPGLGWHRILYDVVHAGRMLSGSSASEYDAPLPGFGSDDANPCVPAADCSLNPVRWSSWLGLLLALAQTAELCLRAVAHQSAETSRLWRLWMFASWTNLAEAVMVGWQVAGYAALLLGAHEALPLATADVFEVARSLPYLRIILVVPRMRDILHTAGGILRLVANFGIVYAGLTYAFSIIGVNIFGGVEQPGPTATCQMCQMYTFDTLPRAWLALFQLTVGNNWNSILYPNIDLVGSRWGAWYFMLYRFLMTDVIMNIIEGVMIEAYSREQEEKEKAELEASAAERMASAAGLASDTGEPSPKPRAAAVAGALSANGSINGAPPSPYRSGLASVASIRSQREVFDDISSDEPPSPAITPRVSARQMPSPAAASALPEDELRLLEEALRNAEARMTPRETAHSMASGGTLEAISEEDGSI